MVKLSTHAFQNHQPKEKPITKHQKDPERVTRNLRFFFCPIYFLARQGAAWDGSLSSPGCFRLSSSPAANCAFGNQRRCLSDIHALLPAFSFVKDLPTLARLTVFKKNHSISSSRDGHLSKQQKNFWSSWGVSRGPICRGFVSQEEWNVMIDVGRKGLCAHSFLIPHDGLIRGSCVA